MKILVLYALSALISFEAASQNTEKGWISLFDGKSLAGWQVGDNASTFSVENGSIAVHGETAHLFYEGPVASHDFKDFEFKAMVMTTPGSNSGIYIHTAYQKSGWPNIGYEIQVNNSHTDWRRTGSVYAIKDNKDSVAGDNVWFEQYIMVKGKTITIKINGKTINEYTEPANQDQKARHLGSGTFALQGHDPKSKVYFKDIMVKPL
ncbi:MAG: DUF1080 domain-containing protein [Chitinophagaceae bacterium]